MPEDQIQVTIQYIEEGKKALTSSLASLDKQFANLMKTNASMMATTGKMFPQVAQQIALINTLGTSIDSGAQKLANLRQEGSLFSRVFSGNTRANLAELNKELGFRGLMKSGSTLQRIGQELRSVQAIAGGTTPYLRDLTNVERFKVMGHVFTEEMHQMNMRMVNWGKNMQWVGRQLMIGLTIPILLFTREIVNSFLTFNRAQTELQKYLYASGVGVEQFAAQFNNILLPAFEKMSLETGLYRDQVIEVASAWAAAGYTIDSGLIKYTDLSTKLNLLSQGEIDLANSIELVRSVQASWGYTTKQTTDQIQKLNLVGNITSLTMQEIADSLPVVSSSASILNIEASELAAVLAGMRERGVSASQAANTLKFSINRLINPTTKATEAWDALGKSVTGGRDLYSTLFNKDDIGRGVQGIEDIATAIGSLGEGQQAKIAGILFGGYRADRMLKLIDAMNDSTSQYTKGLAAASDEVRALTVWEEQLNIVQESSAQKIKVMRVELITLAQKFGEFVFPYIEKAGRILLDFLKKLEQAPAIFKNMAVAIGAVLAAVGPLTYVMSQLVEATGMLARIFAVGPLQMLFGGKGGEDPFGLLNLARGAGKGNMAIQALAGMPIAMGNLSDDMVLSAKSLYTSVQMFQDKGMLAPDVAGFLKAQAVMKGGGLGKDWASTLLPELGVTEAQFGTLLKTKNMDEFLAALKGMQAAQETLKATAAKGSIASLVADTIGDTGSLKKLDYVDDVAKSFKVLTDDAGKVTEMRLKGRYADIDALKRYLLELGGVRVEWDKEAKMWRTLGPTGMRLGTIDNELARLGLGAQDIDDLAYRIDDLQRINAQIREEVVARVGSVKASELLDETSRGISTAVAQLDDAVIPTASVAGANVADAYSDSFMGRIKTRFAGIKEFFKRTQMSILSSPTVGGGIASIFNVAFGTPLKFIIPIVGALGLLSKFDEIAQGFSESMEVISQNVTAIAGSFANLLNVLLGGDDAAGSADDAFVDLGKTLGKFAEVITGYVSVAIAGLTGLVRRLSGIATEAIETILELTTAVSDFINLNIEDAFDSLGRALNPFSGTGNNGSIFDQIIGSAAAWSIAGVAIFKVGIVIKNLITGMIALGTVAELTTATKISTMFSVLTSSLRSVFPLLSKVLLNPWIAIPALVVGATIVVTQFFRDVDEAAQAAAEGIEGVVDAIKAVNESLKNSDPGQSTFTSWVDEMDAFLSRWVSSLNGDSLGDKLRRVFTETTFETASTYNLWGKDITKVLENVDNKIAETSDELFSLRTQQANVPYGSTEFDDLTDEIQKVENQLANLNLKKTKILESNVIEDFKELNNQVSIFTEGFIEQLPDKMSRLDYRKLLKDITAGINDAQEALSYVSGDDADPFIARIEGLTQLRQAIRESGLSLKTAWTDELRFVNRELNKVNGNVEVAKNKVQELNDEIANQISQLNSRVQDSVMAAFDAKMEDRLEALEDAQEEQMDALEDRHERQLEIFDEEAEAQVEAIDKKIEAIDEENEKEEELQQERELRQRRQEMLRQMELSAAIAFRERLKAIHEGRFDDARLIELQMLADQRDQQNQLNELNNEVRDQRDSDRDDKRRTRLEEQKALLQERLDNQRQKLQEQLDMEKEALQERLDNQREAYQEMIDQQRQTLQNMFTELNEELPKNERQWKRFYDDIEEIAGDFGVNMKDAQELFIADWGLNYKRGLNDALSDAYQIANVGGQQVGDAASEGASQGAQQRDEADAKLYSVLAGYIEAQIGASGRGGLSPEALLMWITRIEAAIQGSSKAARATTSKYIPVGLDVAPGVFKSMHTGGLIKGNGPKSDVPINAQEGEYIINRDAVKRVGSSYLEKLNRVKDYHDGGMVSAIGQSVGANALISAIPKSIFHNIASGANAQIIRQMVRSAGRSLARETISQLLGSVGSVVKGVTAPGVGGVWPEGDAGQNFWGPFELSGVGNYGYAGSNVMTSKYGAGRSGTLAARNFIATLRATFPNFYGSLSFDDYSRRGYNGAAGPPWSQHSWGNAVDLPHISYQVGDMVARWIATNADALNVRTMLWRDENHGLNGVNPHVHVDFWPSIDDYTTPPYFKNGGMILKDKVVKFGSTQFETPAMLHSNETIVPANVTRALSRVGGRGDDSIVEIKVEINGDFYGDDNSYRKLHNTLERVGTKVARERGGGTNTRVRFTG